MLGTGRRLAWPGGGRLCLWLGRGENDVNVNLKSLDFLVDKIEGSVDH